MKGTIAGRILRTILLIVELRFWLIVSLLIVGTLRRFHIFTNWAENKGYRLVLHAQVRIGNLGDAL